LAEKTLLSMQILHLLFSNGYGHELTKIYDPITELP
jgi:hypothetical protein